MKLEDVQPLLDTFTEYATVYSNRGADYSVTDLLKSPRQVRLFKRYFKDVQRDVDILKQLGSFRGNAIHDAFRKLLWKVIQKSGTEDYMIESLLWDRLCGRKISGRIDILWKDILYDIKTTSVWKKVFNDFGDWEEQLNMYAFLLSTMSIPVNKIDIIIWYQDWNIKDSFGKGDYPKKEMEILPMKLWTPTKQQDYIFGKIELHKKYENTSDDDLPYCTPKERWDKETTYAALKYTKEGNPPRKASRVLPTKVEIEKWIGAKKGFTIEHRPGERTKCEHWCNVMPFCNQHYEYMEGM